jgi:hypothetical protein
MRSLRLVLVTVALASPSLARAQDSVAQALFEEGKKALMAKDYETACAKLRESDRIKHKVSARVNLASCEEKRGRVATAWRVYQDVLAELPVEDRTRPAIKATIDDLEGRLPRLTLTLAPGAPAGTTVHEGSAILGYGKPQPLDPGEHHLVVAAPRRTAKTMEVALAEGKITALVVVPGAADEAAAVVAPTSEPSVVAEPLPRDTTTSAAEGASPGPWITGGIGVAGFIASIATGAVLLHDKSIADAHCTDGPPPTCRDQTGLDAGRGVRTLGPATTVGLVIGAVGVAAGGVWLGLRPTKKSSARAGIGPMVGGAAWRAEWSW